MYDSMHARYAGHGPSFACPGDELQQADCHAGECSWNKYPSQVCKHQVCIGAASYTLQAPVCCTH